MTSYARVLDIHRRYFDMKQMTKSEREAWIKSHEVTSKVRIPKCLQVRGPIVNSLAIQLESDRCTEHLVSSRSRAGSCYRHRLWFTNVIGMHLHLLSTDIEETNKKREANLVSNHTRVLWTVDLEKNQHALRKKLLQDAYSSEIVAV